MTAPITTAEADALTRRETDIAVIGNPDTPMQVVIENWDRWQAFKERFKELDKLATQAMEAWIAANGPVDDGRMFHWLGHDKWWEYPDRAAVVTALLDVCGGDVEAFCRDYLSANCIKAGSARKALPPELADKLFVQKVRDKLASGEALPKHLVSTNREFLKEKP